MNQNNFLTTAEAAEFMGVRRTTIYSLIKRKAMAYYKPMGDRGRTYLKKDDILAFMGRGRVASDAELMEKARNRASR